MFSINLLWWNEAAKRSDPSEKQPDICDLCGAAINKDDRYYIGLTHASKELLIWANTCANFKCVSWLVAKEARIKTS